MNLTCEISDEQLIAQANVGKQEAFEILYFRYRQWVYALACRFCSNEHDAADVLQETFFYLFNKFPDLQLRCQMKTFLYPVVKHLALSCKRKSTRVLALESEPKVIAKSERNEHRERNELLEMVQKLPEPQREVVILRFADDLDLSEIAQALAIPLGTVKSRLHNALKRLREMNLSENFL